jgi:aspartate/methionine/tyrosine aminotransferase
MLLKIQPYFTGFWPMKINQYLQTSAGYSLALSPEKLEAIRTKGITPINLTIGDPRLPAFAGARTALIEDVQARTFYNYPSTKGLSELRSSFCTWAAKHHDISLNAETEVLPTMGSKEAIFHLPLLFDWNADSAGQRPLMIIPRPGYPVYQESASLLGIETRDICLYWEKNYLPDLASIPESDLKRCQMFWINYPHNPTGAGAPREFYAQLLAMAERYNFLVCSDECYNDMYFGSSQPPSVLDFPDSPHWLLLRSLSKRSHMTGFRNGFYVSRNSDLIRLLLKMRTPMGVASPDFVQRSAIAAWSDEVHVTELRNWYSNQFNSLREVLERQGFTVFPSEAGFYLWCRYSDWTEEQVLNRFLELGVICSGGSAFYAMERNCVRLVFCLPDAELEDLRGRIEHWNS